MARVREVGTLWIGGPLSWMEQLCLKSFVDKGQKITLFSYEPIPNVPKSVVQRDGREIIDTEDFIKYEKKDSFALFADWFRLHMIHKNPGMIWVDTDVYCHAPMTYDSDYVFGYELPGEHSVNNAVLGLPTDSEILAKMLEFTEDRYSIAPFLPEAKQKELRDAKEAGNPVHVSLQTWGVWGPLMITHFVHKLGLQDHVLPLDAFYPITFRDRTKFLRRKQLARKEITENTTALHLWASNKRQIGNFHSGLPPVNSYLEELVQKHEIKAFNAPIKGRAKAVFDTALMDQVPNGEIQAIADLTGHARGFALAMYHKFDCDIQLIDVNERGEFGDQPQDWIAPYIDFLTSNDVPDDKIRVIGSQKQLRPVDVLCNLQGFGDAYKVRFLQPFLEKCLHSDSRMFMDIKQGSGAFPFLKDFCTNEEIAELESKDKKRTRIVAFPKPPEPVREQGWDDIAVQLAGEKGFYRPGPEAHSFLYMERSLDTLVVTFDNLDIAMNNRDDRRPWGFSFIEEQGWSMLGVMAGGWTWYRNPWVSEQFDELRDSGFFTKFRRVVFYGASMGGYAACAFSAAAPGCDVVAISPQTTLDKSIVPWEKRYKVAWDRDFSGPYGDATKTIELARRVSILYDPYEPLDAGHVKRFSGKNVNLLRAPLMGHRLGSSLNQMGLLSHIILGALSGTLEAADYYQLLRKRRDFPRYQRELFQRAVSTGHTKLAKTLGHAILKRNDNRAVRLGLKDLE